MNGPRALVLSKPFRSICKSSSSLNEHPIWIRSNPNGFAMITSSTIQPHQNFNIMAINRRFLHNNLNKSDHTSSFSSSAQKGLSTLKAKFIGLVGAIIGLGTGAWYRMFKHDRSIIYGLRFNTVHCQEAEQEIPEECQPACIPKKCDSMDHLRMLECEEEIIRNANFELERAIMDTRKKTARYTEAALDASCDAICLMEKYLEAAYIVIDNDELSCDEDKYEKSWCCLYSIAKARCEAVQEALAKQMCAWELLCKLREIIEEGKICKYTECNPLLQTAEDAFQCAEQGLLEMKKRMDAVKSNSEAVERHFEVIQAFKQELRDDLAKIPESERCELQTLEQEAAQLVNQAYIHVLRLQKELAQLKICLVDEDDDERCTSC